MIRPTLTDYRGGCLFASTPKGKDFFYSLFMKDGEKNWESWKFSTYDNPHISKEEVDDARAELPEGVFNQEYLAEPSENIDNPFGLKNIEGLVSPLSSKPVVHFGIDLAKSIDFTVIIGLDEDGCMCHFQRFQKDWSETKDIILKLPRCKSGFIDASGVGDVIAEQVTAKRQDFDGFKFTAPSKQNLMKGLQSAIHQKHIRYNEETAEELKIFEYRFSNGSVKYSAPSGFHDDCVMSLALANMSRIEGQNWGNYTTSMI